jgi:hypothetical protein
VRYTRRFTVISFAVAALAANALPAGPSIGVAMVRGAFRIDQAPVTGNATLFAGSTIETTTATSDLQLSQGARMLLGQRSRGRVFADRFVLEQGEGEVSSGYSIESRTLRVEGSGAGSRVLVSTGGQNRIRVASIEGGARVTSASGVLVASMLPGSALEFEPQAAGAAAPVKLTGVVVKSGGKYYLTDLTTRVRVELRGPGLQSMVGEQALVTGTVDAAATSASASQVINVTSISAVWPAVGIRPSSTPPPGAGASAAGPGPSAASAGIGTLAKAAIIGGVAVGATVTGLAVGLTQNEDSNKPLSRQ